jgi:alanyl-tRNA synthetase
MRSALVVLNDGGMPSNGGGGYNLRMLIRRALGFVDRYNWNVDLFEVCEQHAKEMKKLYPELQENLDDIHKILDVEKSKYNNMKIKTEKIISNLKNISEEKMIELYDSQGISPEMIPNIVIPEDFYAKVAERHEKKEQKGATAKTEEINLGSVEDTKALYFDDYKKVEFDAKVVKIVGNIVVLDKTAFYPTSGGQMHDTGRINGAEVVEVWKQDAVILHRLKDFSFKVGDYVIGKVDFTRRKQLAQHHTATHIVNAAARKVLGKHVNQAGAFKDIDKARLDITHYEVLSEEELKKIEEEANKIVGKGVEIESKFYSRNDAEKKFGMVIYQGGAVPGKLLRIVNILGVDAEACGGTHLINTKEVEKIKILCSNKVQDGVIRIVFVAGKRAMTEEKEEEGVIKELTLLLCCESYEVPGRCLELFELWKNVVKKGKSVEKKLYTKERFNGDVIVESARVLKTQPEHVLKTVQRFIRELGMI